MMGLPAPQNAPNSAPHQLDPTDFRVAMKMHRAHCSYSGTKLFAQRRTRTYFCGVPEGYAPELKGVRYILELRPVLERVAYEHGHVIISYMRPAKSNASTIVRAVLITMSVRVFSHAFARG